MRLRLEPLDRLWDDHFGPDGVRTRSLGPAEQAIGGAHRGVEALRRRQARHHAAADTERQGGLARRLTRRVLQLVDHRAGRFRAGLRKQQAERVAAQAREHVARADRAARRFDHQPDHRLRQAVVEPAVHFLVVVEIEVTQRERMGVAPPPLELPGGERIEVPPVFVPREPDHAPEHALSSKCTNPEIEVGGQRERQHDNDTHVP